MRKRTSQIWVAIGSLAQREGSALSPRHACLACVDALGVTGAGLMVTGSDVSLEAAFVSDPRAGEAEDLQTTLGQGPGVDALELGRPILVGDLTEPMSAQRWPAFAPEAARLGVYGMHSLPLALGAIQVGVLDLYSDTPGHLNQDELMDALIYADTALLLLLDARGGITTSPDGEHADGIGPVLWQAQVHQAAGMVSSQLGVTPLDALVRLRAHAHARNRPLIDVARSVAGGRLRLPSHPANSTTEQGAGAGP